MKSYPKSIDKSLKGVSSGWVSVSKDYKSVLAHAKTLDALFKKLEKKGNPEGVVTRISSPFSNYVGFRQDLN